MHLEGRGSKTYVKLILVVIMLGIFCGLPTWFFLTRWQILPLINPVGLAARFEWDRAHGVKTFTLTGPPAAGQMERFWEYIVAAQIKPTLDDYLRRGPWQTASGRAAFKVGLYTPVALPARWGLGGLEIDDPNFTALMRAVDEVNLDAVRKLVAAGADVNRKDQWGSTALMYACSKGRTSQDFVDILLAAGADPNAVNHEGQTALYPAAIVKPASVVQALLRAGADPNHADQRGRTALMAAAGRGNAESVQALLAAGADVNAKGKRGQTALSLSEQSGYTRVVQLLRAAGANQ